MKKFQKTLLLGAAFGIMCLFIDDEAAVNNRLIIRSNSAQMTDIVAAVNHLNSPMPWERK
jgi:hypothetical protein